jgi:aminoglycoside phosphotransferase (APT) family kinase protein
VVTRSRRAIEIAGWLSRRGFPATAPAEIPKGLDQPLLLNAGGQRMAVTFWRYYPQAPNQAVDPSQLAAVARSLHRLPDRPQVSLPKFTPLVAVRRALADPAAARALTAPERAWLNHRITQARVEFRRLDSKLGFGLLHGDLYLGNLLRSDQTPGTGVVLADWDTVCVGPREVDLAPTYTAVRFGLATTAVERFAEVYGHDLRTWAGYPTLRTIRELSTLDTLIRSAPTRPASAVELRHRLGTLRCGDTTTLWNPQ